MLMTNKGKIKGAAVKVILRPDLNKYNVAMDPRY